MDKMRVLEVCGGYLDLLEELGHLVEVEACVDGAVDTLHGQGLVGGQGF